MNIFSGKRHVEEIESQLEFTSLTKCGDSVHCSEGWFHSIVLTLGGCHFAHQNTVKR